MAFFVARSFLARSSGQIHIVDRRQAEYIDRVEVGRRVAGHIRLAFAVVDATGATTRLATAGAEVIAEPTRTPWNSLNARLTAPDGLQTHPLRGAPGAFRGGG
ncbi:MAG: VOC family protein [Micromonosporaceae bacterium]|nr:VOC family protein [Micromonosporaceae bacterium]